MNSGVAYNDLVGALSSADSTVHAAEAHGCLCGALCARRDYGLAEWLAEFLPDPAEALGDRLAEQLYGDVFQDTSKALSGLGMEFEPLLPDDEADLTERIEALGAWSQGYLYGLGVAGTASAMPISEQTSEILADIAECARVGALDSEQPEEGEESYAQIVEYLRVGVQLIFEELEPWRQAQVVSEAQH
jgi:uncharacterized protein YgfB (UPF0149 family)